MTGKQAIHLMRQHRVKLPVVAKALGIRWQKIARGYPGLPVVPKEEEVIIRRVCSESETQVVDGRKGSGKKAWETRRARGTATPPQEAPGKRSYTRDPGKAAFKSLAHLAQVSREQQTLGDRILKDLVRYGQLDYEKQQAIQEIQSTALDLAGQKERISELANKLGLGGVERPVEEAGDESHSGESEHRHGVSAH